MYSHVMLGASDIEASKKFYDAVMGVLGCGEGAPSPNTTGQMRYFYIQKSGVFCITEPIDGNPASHANGATVGFAVPDEATGDKWHATGIANGGTTCEEPPGIREGSTGKMYLAYLRDPAGNKICALRRL